MITVKISSYIVIGTLFYLTIHIILHSQGSAFLQAAQFSPLNHFTAKPFPRYHSSDWGKYQGNICLWLPITHWESKWRQYTCSYAFVISAKDGGVFDLRYDSCTIRQYDVKCIATHRNIPQVIQSCPGFYSYILHCWCWKTVVVPNW